MLLTDAQILFSLVRSRQLAALGVVPRPFEQETDEDRQAREDLEFALIDGQQ